MEALRKESAVVLVDAGNALFATPAPPDGAALRRARLILETMAALRTDAFAPGARDLSAGLEFLKGEAARTGLPVVSVNLVGPDGRRVFPASRVVRRGGLRVGVIGVSPGGPQGPAAAPRVLEEAQRLRGQVDVLVVLAAMPVQEATRLAEEAAPLVDFVLQSHEGRGAGMGYAQAARGAFLVPTGERGRELGLLSLTYGGPGRWLDDGAKARGESTVRLLKENVRRSEELARAATDAERRRGLEVTEAEFKARLQAEGAKLEALPRGPHKGFTLSFQLLDAQVPADPGLERAVEGLAGATSRSPPT